MLGLAVPALATPAKTPNQSSNSTQAKPNPGLPQHMRPVDPPVVPKPTQKPAPKPTPKMVAESAALAQARKTGKPVSVAQDTTSTSAVDANPNGTFTLHATATPTRAQVNGKWVAIDTRLHTNSDHSISPNATTDHVSFSGGGNQPMVTLTQGQSQIAITWPTVLPVPTLDGDTATYPNVLPGVDLRLSAEAANFDEALIIHDATAAANPALRTIRLGVTGTGLALGVDAQNGLTATDSRGQFALDMSTPMMWDSTATHANRIGVATTVATTARANTALTASTRSSATIALSPPVPAFTTAGVSFPLTAMPGIGVGEQNWVEITGSGLHDFDQSQDAQVGLCTGWPTCGAVTVARSYFEMPVTALDNPNVTATIWNADFGITEDWSANGCTDAPVELDRTDPIGSGTRWPGPNGSALATLNTHTGTNCGSAGPIGPVDVKGFAIDAANGRFPTMTFGLRAPDENNKFQWKKFNVNGGSPHLDITYSYPPNPATGLTAVGAVDCTGASYVGEGQLTLTASATDNNSAPLPLGLGFHVSNNNFTGDDVASNADAIVIGSGDTGAWDVPTLDPGDYQARVDVDNNPSDPAESLPAPGPPPDTYTFTKLSPPTSAPIVGTGLYPEGYWGESSDNPGAFGIYETGVPDIAGFSWTLDGPGTEVVPDSSQCDYDQTFSDSNGVSGGYASAVNGVASFRMPAGLTPGYHTFYARAFDYAHQFSPESTAYRFYVSPPLGTSASQFQEAENTAYSVPAGQSVSPAVQNNCCGVVWSGGAQLLFEGDTQGQSFSMTIPAAIATNYELEVNLTKGPDYGIMSMAVDGTPVDINGQAQFDGYSPTVTTSYNGIGGMYLKAGNHIVTVTMVGTNPASTGIHYVAGVDGFYLAPTEQLQNILPVSQPIQGSPIAVQASDASGTNTSPVVEPNDNGMGFPNGAQLLYPATATGQQVQLTFNTAVEADYALGANMTTKSNYGQLQFTVDQNTVLENTQSAPFDAYSANESNYYLPLGGVHLTAGTHTLTITVKGKNANSAGYQLGIEQLTLAIVNNITADSFTDAMNNVGIIPTDSTDTGADFDDGQNAWSESAMAAVGVAPGSTLTTGGATFTIPRKAGASTPDNVLAYGQTIPLPPEQQIRASGLGLLVAASCGWTPEAPTTVTYDDSGTITTANPHMPRVPDWIYGDNNSATTVTPHIDSGGQPDADKEGHLYAVFLPTDPTKTLKSITLPYTGSAQLHQTCDTGQVNTPSLHVFAIAPRPADASFTFNNQSENWLGTWAAPIDGPALPPGGQNLNGQTIRMIVHPTTTGDGVRIRVSNLDTTAPVTLTSATIAAQAGTTGTGAATLAAPTPLTFGSANSPSLTMPVGAEVDSNPVAFPTTTGGSGNLIVSLYLQHGTTKAPVHTTLTNSTFLAGGDQTANADGSPYGAAIPDDYFLTGVDVTTTATGQGTVAIVGDQDSMAGATGGNCGGGSAYGCSWVDDLATTQGANVPGSLVDVSRGGTAAQDQWQLNDGSGSVAKDTGGFHPATVSGGATWQAGSSGNNGQSGSIKFDGSTGSAATSGPVLDTTDSFTVSAWVKPEQLGSAAQTFVVQEATYGSGFYLEYDPGTGKWAFSRVETDTKGAVVDRAESTDPANTTDWTNLVGTFNGATGELHLYVNGQSEGQAFDNTPIAANGPLVIGHGFSDGAANNYLDGSIANVQVYQWDLSAQDVNGLWANQPSEQPAPGAGAPSMFNTGVTDSATTQALPGCPDTILSQDLAGLPNLRTVVVTLGANDVLDGVKVSDIEQNIQAIVSSTRAFGLKNQHRPNGTLVHVLLSTIPPLGLSASDPREAIRKQVNNDITTKPLNFNADGYIDLNSTVVSSTAPNEIDSSYLTDNSPNAAYYQALANAVINALHHLPPTAQL